jgi:hypothetical protein
VATTNTAADQNKDGSPSSIGDGLADSEVPDIDFSNTSYPDFYPDPQEMIRLKKRAQKQINPSIHYQALRINRT